MGIRRREKEVCVVCQEFQVKREHGSSPYSALAQTAADRGVLVSDVSRMCVVGRPSTHQCINAWSSLGVIWEASGGRPGNVDDTGMVGTGMHLRREHRLIFVGRPIVSVMH